MIQPKLIDGIPYCEGALVRTVSFADILKVHDDIDEIWVIRIVDPKQVRPTENLYNGLNNLTMLFAGALGEQNVTAYEEDLRIHHPHLADKIKIIPVEVSHEVNFDWTHSNLDLGIKTGYENTINAIDRNLNKAN